MKKAYHKKRKVNRLSDRKLFDLIAANKTNQFSKFFKHLTDELYKRKMEMKSIDPKLFPFYNLMKRRSLEGIIK